MQINVSQLLKEPIGSTREYMMKESVHIAGVASSMVQGKVKLMRTDQGILSVAKLHTEIEITCSRCLSSFSRPINIHFEEEYFPIVDVVGGTPLPVSNEPGCFTIDEHHILDLNEAIRQYALLAIPMKPLCGADCAGLCPDCGANLNQWLCSCPSQEGDPRWSKLKELSLAGDTQENEWKGAD